jgi:hypothetical protein
MSTLRDRADPRNRILAHPVDARDRPTPQATIEALVYSLRRGPAKLSKPDTLRRMSELDKAQLKAICRRLQNFNPEFAPPWPPEDVAALIAKWRELHG